MNKDTMNAWSLLMDFPLVPSFYLRTRALSYPILGPISFSLGVRLQVFYVFLLRGPPRPWHSPPPQFSLSP